MTVTHAIAKLLSEASIERAGIAPVRSQLKDEADPLSAAYEVQEIVVRSLESAHNPRVGRKVGLTSPAVQKQLGVEVPDFGVLLAGMRLSEADPIDLGHLIAPRIEAEIAFVLKSDVTSTEREAVIAAVDYAAPALEIVDSRIAGWDISILDTVADNASSALFVLGEARRSLDEFDPQQVEMSMVVDGVAGSSGSGADCLGDPVNALVWVAQTAADLGRPLQAGEIVLSGALGPMVPLQAGSTIHATISGVGDVSASVSQRTPERS